MSTRKKPNNFVQRLLRRLWRSFNALANALLNWVLRSFRVNKHRSRQSQAGFVLPTVVMVLLVVALLTTAIVIRSFDRSKNASNYRVDQAVLNAATPALDRAKAKIERLFSPDETGLKGNTPPEGIGIKATDNGTISEALSKSTYTFGDETQLKLAYTNPNPDRNSNPPEQAKQTLETAWKFPVDTDNNGKYDTFTLYGIYFRNPPVDASNKPTRARTPLEARSLPQATGASEGCGSGTASSGTPGWYDTDGQLKKAFFTYVANVPISEAQYTNDLQAKGYKNITAAQVPGKFEAYKGNKGFSALEMQQDQARISLDNNAVWFDDDLVISNVPTFRLNGRIHTNSNLMMYEPSNSPNPEIQLYQVSSIESCYYSPANAEISVGGHVSPGDITLTGDSTNDQVDVHLYQATVTGTPPTTKVTQVNAANKTITTTLVPQEVASNSNAYAQRLGVLVKAGLLSPPSSFPPEIKADLALGKPIEQVLKSYYGKRLRPVSYKEVPYGTSPFGTVTVPISSSSFPPVPPTWATPFLPSQPLAVSSSGDPKNQLQIGDRIKVGNASPMVDGSGKKDPKSRIEQLDDLGNTSRGGFWEEAAALSGSAATQYPDLAGGLRVITGAGIYIDGQPQALGQGTGQRGKQSFLPEPPAAFELKGTPDQNGVKLPAEIQKETNNANLLKYQVVWPDTMPMFQWDNPSGNLQTDLVAGKVKKGDLQMRATVVYHSAKSGGAQQTPIACIATYYDPTNPATAQNWKGLPQDTPAQLTTDLGMSFNGVNYPSEPLAGMRSLAATSEVLQRQANMIFPNGRWVNEPLKKALDDLKINGIPLNKLPLDEISAIDAANCALTILYGASPTTNDLVPDFAIKEQTFLDARQIKAINKRDTDKAGNPLQRFDPTTGALSDIDRQTFLQDITDPAKVKIAELGSVKDEYSLPIEQRQPLEVRVTQIDLKALREKPVGSGGGKGLNSLQEYMLPNSGIIYASRDDALLDLSDMEIDPTKADYGKDKGSSATDFKLDPTRRPNGIRLVNGENLARDNAYRAVEKGLILASDLPVYIKGSFNLHKDPTASSTTVREEFKNPDLLSSTWDNFYTRRKSNVDEDFACRVAGGPCVVGDQWRPARILSDAVTLLSDTFRDGYRNEGDYDLNNNSGNVAVESRLHNGFWWNDFATTSQWHGTDGFPRQPSSYLTNGVTPIQRRTEKFPAYLMEACTKRPISTCGPQDWLLAQNPTPVAPNSSEELRVGDAKETALGPITPIKIDTFNLATNPSPNPAFASNNAGTTAQPPTGVFQISARRVAFKRDKYGALIPDVSSCTTAADLVNPNNCSKATPIGVNTTSTVEVPYKSDAPVLPTVAADKKNALWYWTTLDKTEPSIKGFSYNYDNTKSNLYYLPFDTEAVSERQFLLPGLPEFPAVMGISPVGINGTSATVDDASDFAVFTISGGACKASKAYDAIAALNNPARTINCAASTQAASGMGNLWTGLRNPALTNIQPVISVQSLSLPAETEPPTLPTPVPPLKANAKVNIYNLPAPPAYLTNASVLTNVEITLDRNGQDNPIFVFRTDYNLAFLNAVKIKLKGVDPNNIFWVPKEGTLIWGRNETDTADIGHELVGNFIGGDTGAFIITKKKDPTFAQVTTLDKPIINGGRIFRYNQTPGTLTPQAMTAMTTTAQPLLVPMLQLHSPQGTPADDIATALGTQSINLNYWVQRVDKTKTQTYNAVFIMGDSPVRPITNPSSQNKGEGSGGLGNFPRFLEAWESPNTNEAAAAQDPAKTDIKGSFYQFKKSVFASAPFEAVDDTSMDNSLFFDGSQPDYNKNNTAPFDDYRYKGGAQTRKAPYYRAPGRQWGYDVGLLSQTPDLFSRRFASPTAGTPNEYFRQVNRDDPWIQTLLCAAQPNTGGTAYERAIADPQQLPSNCLPIGDFTNN
jgi:type II secretory pathway pseudopilin PulG